MRYGLELVLLTVGAPGGQTATATTIENFPGFRTESPAPS
jgi:thioredoxin reductase